MDYRLLKAYEGILSGKADQTNPYTSLSQIYEASRTPKQQVPSQQVPATRQATNKYPNEQYNSVIRKALKIKQAQNLPEPIGTYKLPSSVGIIPILPEDQKYFRILFDLAPPTQKGTSSKSSGNGEIALYWLLGKNSIVNDNRGKGTGEKLEADAPDLLINGKGLEVKSYPSINSIALGKFKNDKENRNLLAILLGVDVLFTKNPFTQKIATGTASKKDRPVTVDVFNPSEIENAFKTFDVIYNWLNATVKQLPPQITQMLTAIYNQMNFLVQGVVGDNSKKALPNSAEMTGLLLKRFAAVKFAKKPGWGGYIANVKPSATEIEIVRVDQNKFNSKDSAFFREHIASASGEVHVSNLFELFR